MDLIGKAIYSILPTSLYKVLSNHHHLFLNYCNLIRTHENYDTNVKQMYLALIFGVSLGLGLVTFLDFFPGEPFSYELEKQNDDKIQKCIGNDKNNIPNDSKLHTNNNDDNGSSLPSSSFQDLGDELSLTLTEKINLIIYGSFFIALVYIVNKEYDNLVTLWFIRLFPKEAKTLGLTSLVVMD